MPKIVLLVDDDHMSMELVKRTLEKTGYDIVTAGNGEEALNQLSKKAADLILLDVEMPVMNGYTFMIEKAKLPSCSTIPVIVLTSHKENKPLFQRHGIRAYLVKPLNTDELVDKVNQIIGLP